MTESEAEGPQFSELVRVGLSPDQEGARSLWTPIQSQLDRRGPEAAREYLLTQRRNLAGEVEKLLRRVDERLDV